MSLHCRPFCSKIPRRRLHAALPLTILAVLLAACSSSSVPLAPVEYRDGGQRDRATVGSYTVQRGDTIYSVARQLNMSVRALIDANGLQPPYQLTVGQILQMPHGGEYVVARDDTLLGVAKRLGVSFSTLARINNLSSPYVLRVGQRLKLPAAEGDTAIAAAQPQAPAEAGRPVAVAALPPPAATAPVQVTPAAPQQATQGNAERGGYSSLAEREKIIPPPPPPPPPPPQATAGSVAAPSQAAQPAPTAASSTAPVPAAPPAAVPAAEPAEPAAETRQTAAAAAPLGSPPPMRGRGFIWPVRGSVISEFGTTGKGQHNDGINIVVPRGTPVVAAQDGIVAYAGNELRGFGNLLLVKHADGWMTAYAHNDQLLVKRGDTVKRGQQIAKAGDSGGVSQPQVHFEIRQGTRAVDPMSYLGGPRPSPAASQADQQDPG